MFYSHSMREQAFRYFATFLRNTLNDTPGYKELVQPVLEDAHDLATGHKDYYNISRSAYDVVVYLAQQHKEFFEKLNPATTGKDQYEQILHMVTEPKSLLQI